MTRETPFDTEGHWVPSNNANETVDEDAEAPGGTSGSGGDEDVEGHEIYWLEPLNANEAVDEDDDTEGHWMVPSNNANETVEGDPGVPAETSASIGQDEDVEAHGLKEVAVTAALALGALAPTALNATPAHATTACSNMMCNSDADGAAAAQPADNECSNNMCNTE